jgi:hypothetical protein
MEPVSVRRSVAIKGVLLLGACLLLGCFVYIETMYMGDYSPALTRMAKKGMPLIAQAVAFYRQHDRAPTDDELRSLVHDPRVGHGPLSNGVVSGQYSEDQEPWWYVSYPYDANDTRKGFSMNYKITHDSSLEYTFDGEAGAWNVHTDDIDGDHAVHLNP